MSPSDTLRTVMDETPITQLELSRLSGVKQPNISGFLNGSKPLSEKMLRRLLYCLGRDVIIEPVVVEPTMTRSERRSWALHRQISRKYSDEELSRLVPRLLKNLRRVRRRSGGEPHVSNMDRWEQILRDGDFLSLRGVLIGLDRNSVEMREVSPMSGLLSDEERREVIRETR